jgi:hypothetical protein
MRILGYELRRVPKEEPFDIRISYPLMFNPDDRMIRIVPKEGYRLLQTIAPIGKYDFKWKYIDHSITTFMIKKELDP